MNGFKQEEDGAIILWRGHQWQVFLYPETGRGGVEAYKAHGGYGYPAYADRLFARDYTKPEGVNRPFPLMHVARKTWCDLEDWFAAFLVCYALFEGHRYFTGEELRAAMEEVRAEVRRLRLHSKHFNAVRSEMGLGHAMNMREFSDIEAEATRRTNAEIHT